MRDWSQTAYCLEVRSDDVDDPSSIHIESPDCTLVSWPQACSSLSSREWTNVRVRCYGKFKVGDELLYGSTHWSPWSSVEAALLEQNDWHANMITSAERLSLNEDGSARPLLFYKRFPLPQGSQIERSRLYVTSHGVYAVSINGNQVGDHCMAPGWQSYEKRLHYQIFDVTGLLRSGAENVIDVEVGPGWFASALTSEMRRFTYGTELGVLAQLEIMLQGQAKATVISTDDSWLCATSNTVSGEIYAGEVSDQRPQKSRIDQKTKICTVALPTLISPNAPPIRVTERLKPKRIFKSKSGLPILDFGQNLAGRICVRQLLKPSGHKTIFRHAEVMENGELATRQLRGARSTDTLLCSGKLIENWRSMFTFHGFRYVEVQGWSPTDTEIPLTLDSIVAEVMHCDMQRTGWFRCSNEEVNRLHENALWGMRSNFLSVPTSDPQRDERLGWTGDLNFFCPTANFLYNTTGMLGNWLEDLQADQMDHDSHWRRGVVSLVVPNCIKKKDSDQPGSDAGWDPMPNGCWSDAAIMVPWQLYLRSGDTNILARQYSSMQAYLHDGVTRGPDGLWDPNVWQFGDWLDPSAPRNDSGRGKTDGTFVADCYLLRSTELLSTIASILNHQDDATAYQINHNSLLSIFKSKYITPDGLLAPDTPTAYALALDFNLLPARLGTNATSRLIRALRLNDFRIPTGFVGTAHLLPALSSTGHTNVAYAMLLANNFPSILYPVRMGATTIWERWDSLLPDGTVNPGEMTGFNHYALGSVVQWLYEGVAGITMLPSGETGMNAEFEDGWNGMAFEVDPQIHHALDWAEARFDSRVGTIEVKWRIERTEEEGRMARVDVVVPPNARARIVLPEGPGVEERNVVQREEDQWVGSGMHHFEYAYKQKGEWPVEALLPPWGRASY